MKRKNYETPAINVIWLQQQTQLLAGSDVSATINDLQEEEWDPTSGTRFIDFVDGF